MMLVLIDNNPFEAVAGVRFVFLANIYIHNVRFLSGLVEELTSDVEDVVDQRVGQSETFDCIHGPQTFIHSETSPSWTNKSSAWVVYRRGR